MNGTPNGVSIDDILSKIAPRRAEVRVCLDTELVERHARLDAELLAVAEADTKDAGLTPRSPGLARDLADLEAQIEAGMVTFRFESIGAGAWTALLAAHPPTREQRVLRHIANPLTFNAAAVAASCVDPKMTLEQARQLEERATAGQWEPLVKAALGVNEGGGDAPKSGLATAIRQLSETSSTTSGNGASPATSSLAGN